MRISVCVGEYASIPYCIAGIDFPVYCIEELCYCIKENAFLIDVSLMNDNLVSWIDKNCGLPALARELYPMVHKKGSLSAFVTMILEYAGLYDTAAVREVEQVLKKGAGLSGIEKRKSQIDYLVKKKRYMAAIHGYGELLSQWKQLEEDGRELPASRVRAAILHNRGVAYAGLMMYEQAAQCFQSAYEAEGSRKDYRSYLAAKRMELSAEDYISFAAEQPDGYEDTLELEKQMEELAEGWKEQPDNLRMKERRIFRTGNDKQKYYDENEHLTQALKSSYRSSVSE